MPRKEKTKPNHHYFTVPGTAGETFTIPVKVSDAKRRVVLARTVADVLRGTEGAAVTCANAVCALRSNGNAFPHPVFLVAFTDTRAYVVDKLNARKTPIHCVAYVHKQGAFQKKFDRLGKQKLIASGEASALVVLYPPPKRQVQVGSTNSAKTHTAGGPKRGSTLSRGEVARAKRAGMTFETSTA